MSFQKDPKAIQWRLHLTSPREAVFNMLVTDSGRASFWAESAVESSGFIDFHFPNGLTWHGKIIQCDPLRKIIVEYFGGSKVSFILEDDGQGGTDLTLTDNGVPEEDRAEVMAGWVSVLMALKGAVDFSIDLRNHDRRRTWNQKYIDN